MRSKKRILSHLLSLGALCLAFVLCRYVLWQPHGRMQWSKLLFSVSGGLCLLSFVTKARILPAFIPLAYFVGFLAGGIFQTDGIDPGGGRTNNFWIIWTFVYIGLLLIGAVAEWICRRRHAEKSPPA